MGRDKTPPTPAAKGGEDKKKKGASKEPPAPAPFVPVPGEKLTREQHALLRAQRAKALEEEKKMLFGASWTGKTPPQLLQDQCTRNGWDKPQFSVNKKTKGWQGTVTLQKQDPKTRENLRFTACDADRYYPTELEAKQWAATHALHRFCSGLGVHRMLPPIHQDYWAKLEEARKAASAEVQRFDYAADPFAAKSERIKWEMEKDKAKKDEKEKQEREVERAREKHQVVNLSGELRAAIESLLKDSLERDGAETVGDSQNFDSESLLADLKSKGFRPAHCEEALLYRNDLTAALDWLCLYVPEDDLPSAFALSRKQAAEISGGQSSSTALNREWSVKRMLRTGFNRQICAQAYDSSSSSELLAIANLFTSLSSEAPPEPPTDIDTNELMQSWKDELEALESIYGSEVKFDSVRNVVSVSIGSLPNGSRLEVGVGIGSKYPHELPAVLLDCTAVSGGGLPAYIRLGILKGLAEEAVKLVGLPMIYSLVSWVEENAPGIVEQPPSLVSLMTPRNDGATQTAISAAGDPEIKKRTRGGRRKYRTDEEIKKRGEQMISKFKAGCDTAEYKQMLKARERLPSYAYRSKIIEALSESQVLIICGETGCGKSTQTGQFILESNMESPTSSGRLNIIVTQPRRISALSLAERVAAERGEKTGSSVGYVVRGERSASDSTLLTFVTTGVLLRMLQSDPEISEISHVVVDEVHERSVDGDFLLVILRELVAKRHDLKVVLMSATIDSATFSSYFGAAKVLEIPGFTHPVQDIYLETILQTTGYMPTSYSSRGNDWGGAAKKVRGVDEATVEEIDDGGKAQYEAMNLDPRAVKALLRDGIQGPVDYELVAAIVGLICKEEEDSGAILIFLQGAMEIDRCINILRSQSFSNNLEIYPLHAGLSSRDQSRVFARPRRGKRKVVVSTNIAETSITIDDVVYVIDSGRVKEMQYEDGTLALQETIASRASSKQRRGRAGRVRPGKCYKLFTQRFETLKQPPHSIPEIIRTLLTQLCLTLKSMDVVDARSFLGRAMSAPATSTIDEALKELEDLNAVDSSTGQLTSLGRHMAAIPADLRIAKMLIFGSIFGCLETVLTIAALMSTKSPFVTPHDRRNEARAARAAFAWDRSDWLTDARAYESWIEVSAGGKAAERDFCDKNYLSSVTLTMISDLRRQYFDILADIGFANRLAPASSNPNNKQSRIVKAAIVAGLYPQVARVERPETTYVETAHGTVVREAEVHEIRFFTERDGQVHLHPSSVNCTVTKFEDLLLVFHQKVATSKIFLRDSTMISPWPVLMFGGPLTVDHEEKTITVAGYTKLSAVPRIAVLVNGLRRLLDNALKLKVDDPTLDLEATAVGKMLLRVIVSDG